MTDDDLRRRLAALDPVAPSAVPEPLARGRAAQILEDVMTQLDERPTATPWYRRTAVQIGAAAAVGLLVVGGGAAALVQGSSPTPAAEGGVGSSGGEEPTVLALSLPDPDAAASCIPFEVQYLSAMTTAFAGTVTAATPDEVTIDVDRWYVGGDADIVSLTVMDPAQVSDGGVSFLDGQRYLVTAASGTVNGCGFTGPATPEYEAAFDEAFGG